MAEVPIPDRLIVLLEYISSQGRVIIRGVWPEVSYRPHPPLQAENPQHAVTIFLGVEMMVPGFSGLWPKDDEGP